MDITYFTENSLKIVLGNFTDQRREWRGPLDQLQNRSQCNFIFIPCMVIQDSLGLWIPRALWIPDSTTVFYSYCPYNLDPGLPRLRDSGFVKLNSGIQNFEASQVF